MDIELAIDVMEMAEHLDHIVIFSGDGDFRRLVDAVQRKGVRVTVVSTVRSNPPMVADELRRQCDTFMELQDLAPSIMRADAQYMWVMRKRHPKWFQQGLIELGVFTSIQVLLLVLDLRMRRKKEG